MKAQEEDESAQVWT